MSPLNDEQLKAIKAERKQQIMAAAMKVFADNGLKLTKISMIAKEAGVSHGLLYHYFSSKDEVLHTSLSWATEDTAELFGKLEADGLTAYEKIHEFIKFALTEGSSDIFRVIQHIIRSEDAQEETKKLVEKQGAVYIEKLYPLFVQAQKDGDFIAGDIEEHLELFLTVLSGIMTDDLGFWRQDIHHRTSLLLRMLAAR